MIGTGWKRRLSSILSASWKGVFQCEIRQAD
jgi:hypothetical protein